MSLPSTIQNTTTLPAHLQTGVALGNENVTPDDLQIPRIKLIQKMSPEVDSDSSRFIAGAKAGDLLNSVTGEPAEELLVINLFFETGFTVFKKRDLGGGFFGNFASEAEAKEALTDEGEAPADFDIAQTATHTLLILNDKGEVEMPALMDFASSKLKVSRAWNSDLQLRCGKGTPRYGAVYRIFGKLDRNPRGQTWHNVDFEFQGWADENLFAEASENYTRMKSTKEPAEKAVA